MTISQKSLHVIGIIALACLASPKAEGSSHREAPGITKTPKVDATDFYMFNSYEEGREGFVTLIANYIPMQDPGGGPNYYMLDPNAVYEIHVDNNGDAHEDITFQFRFNNQAQDIVLSIGDGGDKRLVPVPVLNTGPISAEDEAALNVQETYTARLIRGDRRNGSAAELTDTEDGSAVFEKPVDNIGQKSIPNYSDYAQSFIHQVNIPGTSKTGRLFVGQRKDPFAVNLGETFDLVNISTSPLGPPDANKDSLADKNVTSIILEVPKEVLVGENGGAVIGGWTTASRVESKGENGMQFQQVSRLGAPLVNELVIGLQDKDLFNRSHPENDQQFAQYVTHPTLPRILELLFQDAGVEAPNAFPRSDLVAAFLTGVEGLNQNGSTAEMLRLNTEIPSVPPEEQNRLGVIGGDNAGFPNGRRPGDDVVDIALRVMMGKLLPEDAAPSGNLKFTDGVSIDATRFQAQFPYLETPHPGSPNKKSFEVKLQRAEMPQGPYKDTPARFDSNQSQLSTPKSGSPSFYRLSGEADKQRLELRNLEVGDKGVRMDVRKR